MTAVSWVRSAAEPASDFPLANVPFGMFESAERGVRPGVAIGNAVLDLAALADEGFLEDAHATVIHDCVATSALNPLLAEGRGTISRLRMRVTDLLRADSEDGRRVEARARAVLVSMEDTEPRAPVRVGDYTDFYASVHHATNVGSMFRPDNPLLPNYKWVPIGYHGRASSIVPSGTTVRRPSGQTNVDAESAPVFGPSRRVDYELEVGAVIAGSNALGSTVNIGDAEQRIGGLCLINDWSARDIQSWEYQPLGPFLAKSFATTMSPWLVTLDALEPYRAPSFARPATDPQSLPYLSSRENESRGGVDITLEVCISSAAMRERGQPPMRVSLGSFTSMYWTLAQLVTHHTSNGCNLQPGDLLASGTVSGDTRESRGCLLERTWRGTEPLTLPSGEERRFLEDGDEVIMRGWCERPGMPRIGFGQCRGVVTGAV